MVRDSYGTYNNKIIIEPNAVDDHFSDYSESD